METSGLSVHVKLAELQRLAEHIAKHDIDSRWLNAGDDLEPADSCKKSIFIAAQAEIAYVQIGAARLPVDELVDLAGALDMHLAGDADLGLFAALLNATADVRLTRGINPAFAVPVH